MTSKVAIFVVFAIVVQIASANLLLTDVEIANESSSDVRIVEGFGTLIKLEYKKLVGRIKIILRLAYLLKAGRKVPGDEKCSVITETCEERIFGGLIGPSGVALDAIRTINPGLSSKIENARIKASATVSSLAEGVCSAIEIALNDGCSDATAQIEEFTEKIVSEVVISNKEYFNLPLDAETIPATISAAVETANRRATCHHVAAIRNIFAAIVTFVGNVHRGDDSPLEEIFDQLEISAGHILAELNADVRIKLNTIKSIALAFGVIQTANPVDCGAVAPIDVAGFFDNRGTDGSNSHSNPIKISDIFIKTPDEISAEFCELIAAKRAYLSYLLRAMETIFGTIHQKFTETGIHGASTNHSLVIDEAKKKTIIAWEGVADAVYRAAKVLFRVDSDKWEKYTSEKNSVSMQDAEYIFDLIKFTENKKSSGIVHKVAAIAKKLIASAGGLVSKITEYFINAGQINSALQPALARGGEFAIQQIKVAVSNIVTAIKILLASDYPQLQFGVPASSSSLAATKNNAFSAYVGLNALRFYIIETIYIENSLKNDQEYLNIHARIQSSHEIRESNAVQGFDNIFVTARNIANGLSHAKPKGSDDYESELRTANAETYRKIYAENQFTNDQLILLNSRARLTTQIDRESTSIALRHKFNCIYSALKLLLHTNSLEVQSKLHELRNETLSASLHGIASIFTAFRASGRRSADALAAIDHTEQSSKDAVLGTDLAVFAAIEILLCERFSDMPRTQTRFSSVEDAREAASLSIRHHVTGLTYLLEYLVLVDTKMLYGLSDDSCPAEST